MQVAGGDVVAESWGGRVGFEGGPDSMPETTDSAFLGVHKFALNLTKTFSMGLKSALSSGSREA